jgi:hypothetical protein
VNQRMYVSWNINIHLENLFTIILSMLLIHELNTILHGIVLFLVYFASLINMLIILYYDCLFLYKWLGTRFKITAYSPL